MLRSILVGLSVDSSDFLYGDPSILYFLCTSGFCISSPFGLGRLMQLPEKSMDCSSVELDHAVIAAVGVMAVAVGVSCIRGRPCWCCLVEAF